MNDTHAPHAPSPTPTRRRWVLPLLAVALVAAGLGVGLAIAANRDTSTTPANESSTGLANVNTACRTWMQNSPSLSGSDSWCNDMTTWMTQQIDTGRMQAPMMWSDSDNLLATCQEWVSTGPNHNSAGCNDMVQWMRSRDNGDWNGWMMNGPMMDSPMMGS